MKTKLETPSHFSKGNFRNAGFTVTELMVSIGLSFIVLLGATQFFQMFSKEYYGFEHYSFNNQAVFSLLEDLQSNLSNIVKLIPQGDLTIVGDNKYFGLASLDNAAKPNECQLDGNFNVVMATSIDRRQRSETTMRVWDEDASLGQSNAGADGWKNELRITADNTTDSMFQAGYAPKEIILIDAELTYFRRYKVKSHFMHLDTTIDPSDNIDKNPTKYNYVSILLDPPKNAKGINDTKKNTIFISSSMVFASATLIYCYDTTQKVVKKINLSDETAENIYTKSAGDTHEMTNFKISFAATKAASKLDDTSFLDSIFDPLLIYNIGANIDLCTNVMRFDVKFEPTVEGLSEIEKTIATIKRSRMFFLPNFNMKRAVNCF